MGGISPVNSNNIYFNPDDGHGVEKVTGEVISLGREKEGGIINFTIQTDDGEQFFALEPPLGAQWRVVPPPPKNNDLEVGIDIGDQVTVMVQPDGDLIIHVTKKN